jgi:chromosome partitioning protein
VWFGVFSVDSPLNQLQPWKWENWSLMMSIISFASSKGGAGKTTSAIVVATTLAHRGKVCVIDADPAGRLAAWYEKSPEPVANITLETCVREKAIHDVMDRAARTHDYVVVDLEGAATRLNAFVMSESDLVIIPMADEQPDAEGAIETLSQVALEARNLRREIPTRILFNRTQAAVKSRLAKSLNAQVRDKVGAFTAELHARTAYSSLHNYGGDLHDLPWDVVNGVDKAIANAELVTAEIQEVLAWTREINNKGVATHG